MRLTVGDKLGPHHLIFPDRKKDSTMAHRRPRLRLPLVLILWLLPLPAFSQTAPGAEWWNLSYAQRLMVNRPAEA
jgi:hypothetical protein